MIDSAVVQTDVVAVATPLPEDRHLQTTGVIEITTEAGILLPHFDLIMVALDSGVMAAMNSAGLTFRDSR